jgi:uncharacterized ion transporter superfamily protein YfcC
LQGCEYVYYYIAKVANSSVFSLAKSEKNQKYRKSKREEEKKNLARLASGFVFLLANPEFYSQLASGYPHP